MAPWSRRRLSEITTSDVHSLLDKIVERGSPVTANRTLASLRRLCSWAKGRKIITANPCDDIEAPATETARDRILTDDELLAVWRASEAIGNPYVGFIRLLILTGARRSEIAGMRWSEIDIEKKLWTLPKERTKNKREHIVPLSDLAIDIIQHIPRIAGSDCVISFTGGPITGFYPVKNRLDELMPGVPHWTLHDLRRTFASGLARLVIAIHVVEALLNHRSGVISGIAAVYNRHDYLPEKVAAMATWSNYVSALVSGQSASNVHYITKV
ncbi:MAG TPA: site-specific integrase [Methylocella sp.]